MRQNDKFLKPGTPKPIMPGQPGYQNPKFLRPGTGKPVNPRKEAIKRMQGGK